MFSSSRIPVSQDRASQLRLELKEWERAFAASHGGRKPTRDEVKADHTISAKYKEYHKLRAPEPTPKATTSAKAPASEPADVTSASAPASKIPKPSTAASAKAPTKPPATVPKTPTKPAPSRPSAPAATPSKRPPTAANAVTPSRKTADAPWVAATTYESPGRRRIFGTARTGTRDAVGPTPQKTGRVLGLFDSFATDAHGDFAVPASPLRSHIPQPRPSGSVSAGTSPSSSQRVLASPPGGVRSPTTPRKRKVDEVFETPRFLRQRAPVLGEGEDAFTSPPVPRPFARPKRGLSSMVRELREMEEHALDDDEEAMREMEMEAEAEARAAGAGPGAEKKEKEKEKEKKRKKALFEEDMQLPPLPPGAFTEERSVDEAAGAAEQLPSRKKKGLKRQTRRTVMRPVRAKKLSAATADAADASLSSSDDEAMPGVDDDDVAASDSDAFSAASSDPDSDSDSDARSDSGPAQPPSSKRLKSASGQDVSSSSATATKQKQKGKQKGKKKEKEKKEKGEKPSSSSLVEKGKTFVKNAASKINANLQSHMNFRKLNIRNKNSRGKGRFGRRR